jgi:hypothetical protein
MEAALRPMRLWPLLLRELQRFPEAERAAALRAARDTPLEVGELIGMAAGLVATTALARSILPDFVLPDFAAADHFVRTIVGWLVALPLLVATLGPFHLRRLRRGLRDQIRRRGSP